MVKNKGLVRFHTLKAFIFPGKGKLKTAISDLMEEEGKHFISLDYIFCSDAYLLKINKNYLRHNNLTDIITFDLSERKNEIIGEIYISVDRIKENAKIYKASFANELSRVVFHGALHLCGYGDKTNKDQVKMRAKEDYYLQKYINVPRGTK